MTSALNGFGLAIGTMDISGALFFELMIIWMLCWRNGNGTSKQQSNVDSLIGNNRRLMWIYVLLLNVWIVVSMLMIAGIMLHKPQLLLFWLIWCLGGLLIDVLILFWWVVEMLSGDAFEALSHILISLLTMAIEFGFIYIVYIIHMNLKLTNSDNESTLKFFPYFLF